MATMSTRRAWVIHPSPCASCDPTSVTHAQNVACLLVRHIRTGLPLNFIHLYFRELFTNSYILFVIADNLTTHLTADPDTLPCGAKPTFAYNSSRPRKGRNGFQAKGTKCAKMWKCVKHVVYCRKTRSLCGRNFPCKGWQG